MPHRVALLAACLALGAPILGSGPVRAQVAARAIPSIEAAGHAREMVMPDRAEIALRVEAAATSAEEASRDLAAKVNRVLGVLTAAGIPEADTESDGPTVQAVYETVRNERGQEMVEKRRRTGYSAGYGLTLTTGDLAAVPALLPRLAEAGALVRSAEFGLSDARTRVLALEERAVKEALDRARRLIGAAGAKPGRILAIATPGEDGGGLRCAAKPMAMAAAPAQDREIRLPVRPGRIALEARVSVTVEIVVP
ncbi:SIMPL domain-containing protein [uncultured Methylobacterium sp.]|uniref:SIMPL domain-containing protein n=1 Tax=uncultured Methylobacterium sp. TaxID=157278 RepID=UPI0035CA8B60